jgi:hypothetical protein
MKAYLHPKKKPNDRHCYAYDVMFNGVKVVSDSRDPDHDLARALLARGIKGKVTLHDGSTGKPRTILAGRLALAPRQALALERALAHPNYKNSDTEENPHSEYIGGE